MPLFSLSGFSGGFASKLFSSIESFSASGGTELTPGDGFKYHVFLSPGDFVIHSDSGNGQIQYLIVAGGGGSGSTGGNYDYTPNYWGRSGGGGAGGVLTGTTTLSGASTYAITVGDQSPSQSQLFYNFGYPNTRGIHPNLGKKGEDGNDSTFNSLTAVGGGGGGAYTADYGPGYPSSLGPVPSQFDGNPGGSGGGGGGSMTPYNPSLEGSGGDGTPGQGNPGGDRTWPSPPLPNSQAGGAGGGAGGAGPDSTGPSSNPGGAGLAVPAFPAPAIEPAIPAPVRPSWTPSVGPTGIYGKGGPGVGSDGVNFTGQGGGGVGPSTNGRRGGAGIVIVKYPV